MKIKMLPKTYRIIAKFWPLICGLIIGGLLGGIMHSFSFFMLFGAIGWAYFYFDFFHVPDALAGGIPCELGEEEEGGPGIYLNDIDAMLHGAMFSTDSDDDGASGYYM